MKKQANQLGFTLLELLVGITILSLVVSAVYASFRLGLKTYDKIEQKNYISQNVRSAWQELSRDIRCAFFSQNDAAGFVGKDNRINDIDTDSITFTTYLPALYSESGGLARVSYYIDTDPGTPYEGLVCEYFGFPFEKAERDTKENKIRYIAPLCRSLNLRYFDASKCYDGWDSQKNGFLPISVEITITVIGENDDRKTITTIAPLYATK